nr:hypothetical protein GCM10025699_39100 [Microbacterium flavescens]
MQPVAWRRPLQYRRHRRLALVNCHVRQRIDLANYPAVHNWYERIKQRPATSEAMLKIQLY